ncbi:MAG: hypothetical protein E7200_06300 [Selenomonas ruminantium]|nr:hypothetical protein [Selenomonas ruminantium]
MRRMIGGDVMTSEEKDCETFDTGRFNEIMRAYLVLAMRDAKVPAKMAGDVLEWLQVNLDEKPAQIALAQYRKVCNG